MNEQATPKATEFENALAEQHASEEVEVWTGACSIRIFLPAIVACLLISAVLYAIARFEGADAGDDFLRYTLEGLILVGWILLLGFAGYRVLGTEYMLTNKRFYCRRGFGHPGREGVDLTSFLDVRVTQSSLERWLRRSNLSIGGFGLRQSLRTFRGSRSRTGGRHDPETDSSGPSCKALATHPMRNQATSSLLAS